MDLNQQPIDDNLRHEDLEPMDELDVTEVRRNISYTPKFSGNPAVRGTADGPEDEQNMYGNDAVSPNLGAEIEEMDDLDVLSNIEDLEEDPSLLEDEGSTLGEEFIIDDEETEIDEQHVNFDPEAVDIDNWGRTDQNRHMDKPLPSESEIDRQDTKGNRHKKEI